MSQLTGDLKLQFDQSKFEIVPGNRGCHTWFGLEKETDNQAYCENQVQRSASGAALVHTA